MEKEKTKIDDLDLKELINILKGIQESLAAIAKYNQQMASHLVMIASRLPIQKY